MIKKILAFSLVMLLALGGVFSTKAQAADVTSGIPPYVSVFGGQMRSGSALLFGQGNETSCSGYMAYAAVDITTGDTLILAGTTYPLSVSKVAGAGSAAFFGIAITDASAGNVVQVCTRGKAKATLAITTTYGDLLVSSATAGKLTASAAIVITETAKTATAARALQTKTVTGGTGTVLIQILGY